MLLASAATADTLTFDTAVLGQQLPVTENGYRVRQTAGFHSSVLDGISPPLTPPYNATRYLNSVFAELTLDRLDGDAFALIAFDGAESVYPQVDPEWILVTGFRQDGSTVSHRFDIDQVNDGTGPLNDFQTFTLPIGFHNVVAVSFLGRKQSALGQADFSMDNVIVGPSVPEPRLVALLLAAGCVALRAQRGRRVR